MLFFERVLFERVLFECVLFDRLGSTYCQAEKVHFGSKVHSSEIYH